MGTDGQSASGAAGGGEAAPALPDRATPLTILTPLRPWWAAWVRFTWLLAALTPLVARPLRRLSFIHFAHWSLITRWPVDRRLPAEPAAGLPWMVFQTNFNGSANQYIAAFCRVVPGRIRLLYWGAYGFPGPRHAGPVEHYIEHNSFPASHFYSAHPQASVTMITAALELRRRFHRFAAQAAAMDAAQLAPAYRRFLGQVQSLL